MSHNRYDRRGRSDSDRKPYRRNNNTSRRYEESDETVHASGDADRSERADRDENRFERRGSPRRPNTPNPKDGKTPKQFPIYQKNEFGHLLISFVVKSSCQQKQIETSIDSMVSCTHAKKKMVISFESGVSEETARFVRDRFKIYNVTFFTRKSKSYDNSTQDEAALHNEVFETFKSELFLMMNSRAISSPFAIEKSIKFLCKPGSGVGIFPKFYDSKGVFIQSCRRFAKIWDLMPTFCSFIAKKKLEHKMMERGEIGYMSIHRVDWSFADFFLILSDVFKVAGKMPVSRCENGRDSGLCKKIYSKSNGSTITFFPSARCMLNGRS